MLGFSLGKLLVLLAIIAAVWYGFKWLSGRHRPVGRDREGGRLDRRAAQEDTTMVHDMETCAMCGTFVPTGAARACGRDRCPYPD